MYNPFRKRASENISESEAFLQLVSSGPIEFVLGRYKNGELYDRLVFVLGTPGSGKTTLGRLFEYRNLRGLAAAQNHVDFRPLAGVLTKFGALGDQGPAILAARIVMDSEYRGIWELPYDESLKHGLFRHLIQSRAVLLWLDALADQGIKDHAIEVLAKTDSAAARESVGCEDVVTLRNVATRVEQSVYRVVHALVPMPKERLESVLTDPYDPLSVLSCFCIKSASATGSYCLRPMILIDDAHELHNAQFGNLTDWFIKRDLRVARWIMTRLDIFTSSNAWFIRPEFGKPDQPGRQEGRDYIRLFSDQALDNNDKRSFKTAAKDIAKRYLMQMPSFSRPELVNLSNLLDTRPPAPAQSQLQKLGEKLKAEQRTLRITDERIKKLQGLIDEYPSATDETEDVRKEMLSILMHRYIKRTPQQNLFEELSDLEPRRELNADIGVLDGARIHLYHDYERPYYYGFDALVEAGTGNIEQFLKIADVIVDAIESRLIRRKPHILDAVAQQKLIFSVAKNALESWDFPLCDKVRRLVDFIGLAALEISMQPNAPLDHGANAYGIRQSEFDNLERRFPLLAQVLHYAIAYNAIKVIPNYSCKNETWALLQLGGYPTILYGLPFKKGGFVEGGLSSLQDAVQEVQG